MIADAAGLPSALIVAKDEQFVLDHWAAGSAAKLFETGLRKRYTGGVLKGIARLLAVSAIVIKTAAMKLVRARLGLHGHNTRDRLAELGVIVL